MVCYGKHTLFKVCTLIAMSGVIIIKATKKGYLLDSFCDQNFEGKILFANSIYVNGEKICVTSTGMFNRYAVEISKKNTRRRRTNSKVVATIQIWSLPATWSVTTNM